MSAVLITIFYAYYYFAVNCYRREIHLRFIAYSKISGKDKALRSLRKAVLYCFLILAANILIQIFAGSESVILLNTLPVIFCCINMYRYRRRINRLDCENKDLFDSYY